MIEIEFTKTEWKINAFVRTLSSVTKYTYLSKRQKLWVNVRWVQTCGNNNERGQRKFSLLVLVMALLPAPSPSPRRRPRSPTPPRRSRPRSPVAGHTHSVWRVTPSTYAWHKQWTMILDNTWLFLQGSSFISLAEQEKQDNKSGIINPNGQIITHQRKWSEEMRNQSNNNRHLVKYQITTKTFDGIA